MCAVACAYYYLFAAHLCVLVALVPAEQVLLHQQFLDHSRVECGQRLLESFGEPQLGVSHGGGRPHCGRRGKGGGGAVAGCAAVRRSARGPARPQPPARPPPAQILSPPPPRCAPACCLPSAATALPAGRPLRGLPPSSPHASPAGQAAPGSSSSTQSRPPPPVLTLVAGRPHADGELPPGAAARRGGSELLDPAAFRDSVSGQGGWRLADCAGHGLEGSARSSLATKPHLGLAACTGRAAATLLCIATTACIAHNTRVLIRGGGVRAAGGVEPCQTPMRG
jgi:hypothetical protein